MNLDGVNNAPPVAYSLAERQTIQGGLISLGNEGGVWIISHVIKEVEDNHTGDFSWIYQLPSIDTAPGLDPHIDNFVKAALAFNLVNPSILHTKDPADPWILAVARKYGHVIVTDELPKAVRRNRRRRDNIPDVCTNWGIPWTLFQNFVTTENLL